METGRRRRFINFVNRNLERALAVNTPSQGRVVYETENPLFESTSSEDLAAISEDQQRRLRRLERLNAILLAVPRALRGRVENSHIIQQLREAVSGLRIDQLPEALLEQLNELNVF